MFAHIYLKLEESNNVTVQFYSSLNRQACRKQERGTRQ